MDKPIVEVNEVVEIAEEAVEIAEEVIDKVSKKSVILKVIVLPFKGLLAIGKFGIRRFKIFSSKFRRFTNYATDDEKGPVIRFTSWLFFRVGFGVGIVAGLILQHYINVVQFVIDLFS